jgi:DNA mismatch repair protein MutL
MPDIIHLLPEATANMIAAGEVVQRPASVVKELLENSMDAGADDVQLHVADGGQTLIQVIDNGKGMSETDARMCWERHATSKIKHADDLFKLNTFGFRGEAMASIAAVSLVELKTRTDDESLGTYIQIEASEVRKQEPVQCPKGTSLSVKNLFFNIPARRNFLKSVSIETKHIIEEFQRVALANPQVAFTMLNNGSELFKLEKSDLKTRVADLLEVKDKSRLLTLEEVTDFIQISGYVGDPSLAKRTRGDQYFFVNGRYIKEPYFHHAVVSAYSGLIDLEQFPIYAIFLQTDPSRIDVNVHPSKTEVKFEDGKDIYAILRSVAKKALAAYHHTPLIPEDAFTYNPINLTKSGNSTIPSAPEIAVNPAYNPFGTSKKPNRQLTHWEKMYDPFRENENSNEVKTNMFPEKSLEKERLIIDEIIQIQNTYLVFNHKEELLIVNQQHAHERVLYERYKEGIWHKIMPSQQLLFPRTISFNPADTGLFLEMLGDINRLGFDISHFGKNSFIVNGIPPDMQQADIQQILERLLDSFNQNNQTLKLDKRENLIRSMARNAAIRPGQVLTKQECQTLISELFATDEPSFTPFGKPVFVKFVAGKIDSFFNI